MAEMIDSRARKRRVWGHVLRFSLAVLGLIGCYRLIEDAARTGVSRLFSTTSIIQSSIEAADEAVRLAPSDPEAHYTRALALVNLDRLSDAIVELRQATRLRSHHYYEWLDLGVTLDRMGDAEGADVALKESVRLAPNFAQPRWQLGSHLYRQGLYEEAFAELRLGAASNPKLTEALEELAWVAANGDVATIEGLIQPSNRRSHLELASFLAKRGKGSDAVRQVREAGVPEDEVGRTLLHKTISELFAARLFSDAYGVWEASHPDSTNSGSRQSGQFLNGDFVEPIIQDDPGFGWQVLAVPGVGISIDPSGPVTGARSVRIEFSGDIPPGSRSISQMVLVQPNSRYSLSFKARSENLLSGGPPVISALDASNDTKILGQSKPLSPGTGEWSTYQFDFSTDESTAAVIIALQRLSCNQSPCPVFGRLWLSSFSLSKNQQSSASR
jgi:Flp pilus assembly protein TadD